jgi:hypothetical protein
VVSELIDDEFIVDVDVVEVVVVRAAGDDDRIRAGEVEGVTKSVVDEGFGAAENGFGTSESTTPIGPSKSISDSGHVNSSG